MTNTLKSQPEATDVPPGGTVVLQHHLVLWGTPQIPDQISIENSWFDVDHDATTDTTITVTNTDPDNAQTGRFLCEKWHTIERVFGDGSLNLPDRPFVDRGHSEGGGGGGGGPTNWQSFTYTATGAEGTEFTVTIPTPQPSADYFWQYSLGTTVRQFAVELVTASRLVGSFDVETTTAPELGDIITFSVWNNP